MLEPDMVYRNRIVCQNTIVVKDGTPVGMAVARTEHLIKPRRSRREIIAEKGRALWDEAHAKDNPTPEWFSDWVSRVPNFDCACRDWLNAYILENPPRFDDFYAWSVECHNAVNAKLDRPIWSPQ